MKSPADRLHESIHRRAAALARSKAVPSVRHAQAIVQQLVREQGDGLPPPLTVASLAEDLLRAILRAA